MIRAKIIKDVRRSLILNHQAGNLQVLNKIRSLSIVARYPIANKKLDNGKFTAAIAHMEGSILITSPLNSIFFFSKISKIKRDFLTNSSCGVCGKSSLDALEIIKKDKTDSNEPKISKEVIVSSPNTLRSNQSEFSKTGGIHASGLLDINGKLINLREDVGRHNALDKLIGSSMINDQIEPKNQFITCSGRLNFELVQKVLMTNIGIMVGVGAPTSLAIDLANKFDMTLIGFVKKDSFNVYTNNKKVIVD